MTETAEATATRQLAAASLIRAVLLDDADSGILILHQHTASKDEASAFALAMANVATRALLTGHGCRIDHAIKALDSWAKEYADRAEVASGDH